MVIKLYINNSERVAINKSLSNEIEKTGAMIEESSLLNPVLLVEGNPNTLANINYMYISDFNRYYFVTDITSVKNGLMRISARVDVLMSYKNKILENVAIIERQEKNYDLYLNDPEFSVENRRTQTTKNFPNGFTMGNNYFLTVVGGYYETGSEV